MSSGRGLPPDKAPPEGGSRDQTEVTQFLSSEGASFRKSVRPLEAQEGPQAAFRVFETFF